MNTTATFDRCLTFLETQLNPKKRSPHAARPPTVTISRQTGSGGVDIAERLAALLQLRASGGDPPWTVFNRSLIERVLAEHHLPPDRSRFMPEDRVSYIEDTLEELFGLHASSSTMVSQISETILGLAELGGCILVGRGANLVLAKCDSAFHVRLVGSVDRRVQRVAESRKVDFPTAREYVRAEDAARRRYIKSYFEADIDDPLLYHVVLNTDAFTPAGAAETIAAALSARIKAAEGVVSRAPVPSP